MESQASATVLVFNAETAHQVEIDFRGSVADVQSRIRRQIESQPTSSEGSSIETQTPRGRGRPKLGVIAREVTLLPRHWAWLKCQPGGASVTLRKLVEKARKANIAQDERRESQDATYRFTSVMAGDLPAFEEAMRALFSGSESKFENQIKSWPKDIRTEARRFGRGAF